jgi:hypothetical protein
MEIMDEANSQAGDLDADATSLGSPGLSERIVRLRSQIMARRGSFVGDVNPFIRSVALWQAAQPGRSRVQVRAAYLHELVKLAPIDIADDWTLAGNHLPTQQARLAQPDPSDPEHRQLLQELGVAVEEIAGVRDAVIRWQECHSYAAGEVGSELQMGAGKWGTTDSRTVFWAAGWIENHSIRDYASVLRVGFQGLRSQIEEALAAADVADADYPQKENFWLAALHICDAGMMLGRRYAEVAAQMAEHATSNDEASRLRQLAARCAQVPAHGARSFAEAVQALWFAHILTCGEDGINANSIGRLDQILYPYYRADIDSGRLTRGETVELMEELACRLYLE